MIFLRKSVLHSYLRIVQRRRQHLHVVQRLLGRVLRRLGRLLGLVQLLNFALQRLMRIDALLFQPLQQHLLTGQRSLSRCRSLGRSLGQSALRHVRSLFGRRNLVGHRRIRLIRRALRNRPQPTAGTVAGLGLVQLTGAGPIKVVIATAVVLLPVRDGTRVKCLYQGESKRDTG